MTRFTDQNPLVSDSIAEERLKRVEEAVRALENRLYNSFTQGRIRFDRSAPTSSADVQTPDKLYDIVRDSNFEYVLINNAGTLAWRKIIMSIF